MKRIVNRFLLAAVAILFTVTTSCTIQKSPVTGQSRAYGYSWEEEKEIGREADQQIQQQYGIYDDPELLAYVRQLGRDVLSVSHMRREDTDPKYKNTEFHFRVLNSEVVNAFALPGGYIYVTRGLLSHLNNEAQLAVVLGHEIGHVAARHASQRVLEQQIGQIALIGGAVAGQELLGLPGQDILNLGGTAAQLLFLRYGRDDERESDRLGVEYAALENYQAGEGAEFFNTLERLSEQAGQNLPSFLSTHPDPGERESTIRNIAEQWRNKGYSLDKLGTEGYMRSIGGMIYGKNPREGFARNWVFYHPDLEFHFPYPEGWRLSNQPSRVVISNEQGDAVVLMQLDADSSTPRASVEKFVNQQGIVVLRQSSIESNGLPAHQAIATATTQDGTELGIYVYGLAFEGTVYRFISYTTQAQFENYLPEFERITTGFDRLTDTSILTIEPVRLQVSRAGRSGSFRSFLPDNLPMEITAEELAIVNQVRVDDRIEKGRYLKLPEQ
ncbi:MAG: M48 family metalloprotease [Balneolaceae bacterium]|nr:M48 family metalloprotease [Balneolaceae bacterium]